MHRMIVVAGEALIDLVVAVDGRLTAIPGGGPFNTARTIARLGQPVAFLGRISTDRFGARLRDRLVEDRVDVRLVAETDNLTTLAVAELDETGSATYRFYTEGTSAPGLTVDALPARLPADGVTAVHVGTLGLVLEPLAVTLEALVARTPSTAIVMLDPNGRPSATPDRAAWPARVERLARRADIVKASADDLRLWRPGVPPAEAVDALLGLGVRVVLLTDGGRSVTVATARGVTTIHPPAVRVVDTVGAGDAFGGGFLAAWIGSGRGRADLDDDAALVDATNFAVRVASFTCTRAGAEPPTEVELEEWRPDVATGGRSGR
jgi:fructokinase